MGELFVVKPLSAIRGVVQGVRGDNVISPLPIPLPWPSHCFYIFKFNRDDLLKLGSTISEEQKPAVNVVNNDLHLDIEMFL